MGHITRSAKQEQQICVLLLTCWLGVAFLTRAVWQRAAPLPVQLTHARCVADDCALADAAIADY